MYNQNRIKKICKLGKLVKDIKTLLRIESIPEDQKNCKTNDIFIPTVHILKNNKVNTGYPPFLIQVIPKELFYNTKYRYFNYVNIKENISEFKFYYSNIQGTFLLTDTSNLYEIASNNIHTELIVIFPIGDNDSDDLFINSIVKRSSSTIKIYN